MVPICVPRTLNWQDEDLVNAEVLPELRPERVAWNATFNMP